MKADDCDDEREGCACCGEYFPGIEQDGICDACNEWVTEQAALLSQREEKL